MLELDERHDDDLPPRCALGVFFWSQRADLHFGQIRTSTMRGTQRCPHRLHVSVWIRTFAAVIRGAFVSPIGKSIRIVMRPRCARARAAMHATPYGRAGRTYSTHPARRRILLERVGDVARCALIDAFMGSSPRMRTPFTAAMVAQMVELLDGELIRRRLRVHEHRER